MINDLAALAELDQSVKMSVQKIVDEKGLCHLVDLFNNGDAHAHISDTIALGGRRWCITVITRSADKWHQVREWRPS